MGFIQLFILAVGLSMDAFAVAVCTGLSTRTSLLKTAFTVGLYFGFFQALMPLAGYFVGTSFADNIRAYDHWIAFIILAFIGGKMIWESFAGGGFCPADASTGFKRMLPLAVATSIDALAVGIGFAFLHINIFMAVVLIGVITFIISAAGIYIGHKCGTRFKSKAEFAGGAILMLIGLKILLEHLGVL